jgi:hypothetical protein
MPASHHPCIALIADMARSRDLPPSQRPAVQQRFQSLVAFINKKYRPAILSRFVITLGDEFQGLLRSGSSIPDLLWDIDARFSDRRLRVGFGFGVLYTPLQKEAINIDGPALHFARAAIDTAVEKRAFGGVFLGFSDMDQILNGFARVLWFQRSRLTATQLRIAELLRERLSQPEIAHRLRITQQAVSKQSRALGWSAYAEAALAWRIVFERYIDPKIGHKTGRKDARRR